MKFTAEIDIMPLPELLDPQGKAVLHGLNNLNMNEIGEVRVGKHIRLQLEAESRDAAEQAVKAACEKLLVNPVMEQYRFELNG